MGITHATIGAQRVLRQGLAAPVGTTPDEVVRWLGAVQAQDFLGSLWALGSRLPGMTEAEMERAIAARTILRTWPMRGTVHFVPAEDARWMVNLLAPKVVSRAQSIYRKAGIDATDVAHAREVVGRTLAGGQWLARGALYARMEEAGIATGQMRGLHLLGILAQEGLICFGPRDGKQPTFTLLDEWAPQHRTPSREEAIVELAWRYFRSHGPATIRDFTWWTGLLQSEAQEGLAALRERLEETTIDGTTYWWADQPAATAPAPSLHLLPPFDEFLVSYKDRSASLDPRFDALWAERDPLSSSTIVCDGTVIGTWRRTIKGESVAIDATFARALNEAEEVAFEAVVARYGTFLGLAAVVASRRVLG